MSAAGQPVPAKATPPPYVKPLIAKPLVYRRQFRTPEGKQGVAEFHEDKLVLRARGGRRRHQFTFAQLWAVWTGHML